MFHVHERLAYPRFITLDQRIGFGVDASHAGNIKSIPGTAGQAPGRRRLDRPFGR
ncbi:hypothetical protein [Salinisphaera shabanensis]|uniref:hypothetical protein n=1 Tax=Salinisphaera shabanensis TaxID=180542 RepID=UPI0033428ED6